MEAKEKQIQELKNLSSSESLIMKAIWSAQSSLTIKDLVEILKTRYAKDYSRTTVSTFVQRLTEKHYLCTYREGKKSYIRVLITEDQYKHFLMEQQMNFWFEGKPSALVAALCSSGTVSKQEAGEIRDILDGLDD